MASAIVRQLPRRHNRLVTKTALIIEVPKAELLIGAWRERHDPVAGQGVPSHITVLHPFMAAGELKEANLDALKRSLRQVKPFDFSLTRVDQFPGSIWLRPEPDQHFRRLTKLIWDTFPDYPPYRGVHPDSQPHLTIAITQHAGGQAAMAEQLTAELGGLLPLEARASALSVFAWKDNAWSKASELPLGT